MPPLSATDARLRGQIGGLKRQLRADAPAQLAAARSQGPGNLDWHARRVDPHGELEPSERERRAVIDRKLYYRQLNYRARAARQRQPRPTPPAAGAGPTHDTASRPRCSEHRGGGKEA